MNASPGVHSRGIFSSWLARERRGGERGPEKQAEGRQRVIIIFPFRSSGSGSGSGSGSLALICQGERSLFGACACGTVESGFAGLLAFQGGYEKSAGQAEAELTQAGGDLVDMQTGLGSVVRRAGSYRVRAVQVVRRSARRRRGISTWSGGCCESVGGRSKV
jgi:hypothetical protein